MSKFKIASKAKRGFNIERRPSTTNHSDFVLHNKNTGESTVVPQTSLHRYVNDYGWTLSKVVAWRNGKGSKYVTVS